MNRRRVNTVLAGIVLVGTCAIPGMLPAEEPPTAEVTTGTPAASGEDAVTTWDKTKEVSADTWDATKEGSAKAWDKTKEVSADTWDATKEGSAKAWDKTKEVSADAWDATKEGTASAWDSTRDMVQGEPQTESGSETDAIQESPAAPSTSP